MPKLSFTQISSIDDNGLVNPKDIEMGEAGETHLIPPTLLFHARKTSAGFTRTEQRIYSKYKGDRYWALEECEPNQYVLVKHHQSREVIVPNGSYIYVVIKDLNNNLKLRIGMGRHVFLAQPENIDNVVIAGDIKFAVTQKNTQSAEIVFFNNNSGAFHAVVGDKSVYERRAELTRQCLEKVGLPLHKFVDVNENLCYDTSKRRKSAF
ncbi:hypothetical protein CC99x_003905 [Candidatus Berkiella cookevillensis]|uniref:Uncharacterized protein n=1 Tax=Candidatus Berkiella cookevillensis TaxID=437022 RepID=A0A0Q9YAC1_9GAMM|nr:hypothetical protein [Candidatus Berkiella cookevillensis]MCS5708043.1 hypothetical protein [Candidatus Berkiella cookevillensis]